MLEISISKPQQIKPKLSTWHDTTTKKENMPFSNLGRNNPLKISTCQYVAIGYEGSIDTL